MKFGRFFGLTALAIALPSLAFAQNDGTVVVQERDIQTSTNKIGARGFFGLDPDQFGVGVQSRFGRVAGTAQFAPSVDFGFGDDLTTIAINGDILWDFPLPGSSTRFYAGGGPALTHWSFDNIDASDLEIGVTGVFGVTIPMGLTNKYNAEFRYGIGDVPELRFLFGLLIGS